MAGLGISIDEQLAGEFSKFIEERGYTKYRAVEGAIRAFMAFPPEAQVALMGSNVDAQKVLIKSFRDLDIEIHLEELSPAHRNQILALAREAAKIVTRKRPAP